MSSSIKIALVADIHCPPVYLTSGSQTIARLRSLAEVAEKEGADLLIDLGDRVTNVDGISDSQCVREIKDALSAFSGSQHHLLGNHDVALLSPRENEILLGDVTHSRVVDAGTFQVILWQPGVVCDPLTGFQPVGPPHLRWLAETLAADSRPAVIASHVPVSGYSMIGNRYFEGCPGDATYPDADAIREVLSLSDRTIVWVSGHVHWNTATSAGAVSHLTVQSMNEIVGERGEAADAIAFLELDALSLRFDVRGKDPFFLRRLISTRSGLSRHQVFV